MIYTISKAFIQGPDLSVIVLGKKVNTKMTGNPAFTTPDPPLTALVAANTLFEGKVDALGTGGTQATKERDAARTALIVIFRALILYVEKIAAGDPVVMLSAGFDINSSDHAPTTVTTPVIQSIDFGDKGAVILHAGAMGNALTMKVRYRIPGQAWVDGVTTSQARNIVQPGLVSGQTYEFALQAYGTNNQVSDWSDYVSHMAP
jgi:hypothetical protein